MILDWEYAGFGNPWFDAAALHNKLGISIEELSTLPAFKHLKSAELEEGIVDAIWLTDSLESLWLSVRALHKD